MSVLRDTVQNRLDRQARRAANAPRMRALKAVVYTALLVVVLGIIAIGLFPDAQPHLPAPLTAWLHRLAQLF